MLPTEYRPCVVAVFTNSAGQFLVCERSDIKGAWQFPQGGIEPGESALNAVYREMREEIGTDDFRVLKEGSGMVKYKFPDGASSKIAQRWLGQTQVWFLAAFDSGVSPNLAVADGEFVAYEWRSLNDVMKGIVDWKKDSYREGLKKLGFDTGG